MILFKKITDLRNWLESQRKNGKSIGFVPTMGALHPGHLSLIETSLNKAAVTVCSIFVNPTQFNDPADFSKYPVTIESDIELLEAAGTMALFLPDVKEIYPNGGPASKKYDLGYLETVLDGSSRPGHFQGVCTVVERLLEIVEPDHLMLGQKDYQQCLVITRLLELMGDTGKRIQIHICPTLREKSGLAMSSRNMRLNMADREKAALIHQCLLQIRNELEAGKLNNIKQKITAILISQGFRPDYVELANARNLTLTEVWDGKEELVALIAAFLSEVRLIDNMLIQKATE
ncbi:MAG: pantoate--beta-alanine ligase [Chitinophagaceae bacterium]|nr:pantoate--beta-alanine ligase [Chitinophagaceae bacterium]